MAGRTGDAPAEPAEPAQTPSGGIVTGHTAGPPPGALHTESRRIPAQIDPVPTLGQRVRERLSASHGPLEYCGGSAGFRVPCRLASP